MRKSFISLGVLASVQVLPAFAHEMPPIMAHAPMLMPTQANNHHFLPPSHQNGTSSSHTNALLHTLFGGASGRGMSASITNLTSTNAMASLTGSRAGSGNHPLPVWSSSAASGTRSAQSLNLDLSSTAATMTAGALLHNGAVTIEVGGSALIVTATTQLTPAEYLAVMQVTSGAQQSLTLDNQGSASGGSIVINQHLSQALTSLVIPQGVTVIDLTRSGSINIAGNITDDGSLYISSTNPTLSNVSLGAGNITVQGQGLISDVLPAGSLSGLHGADAGLNLSLNAVDNVANAGTITSGGTLNITAVGSVVNALPQGATGSQPVIQAANNVNLVVGSGNITNTGLIASTNGSINIATTTPTTDLNINATGGTFQALAGNINVRDALYTGASNMTLSGGNYLSQNLNLNSGTGTATGNIGEVSGQLNTVAQVAHINAQSSVLTLGNQNISGDPAYANTGDIDIAGALTITGGANLAIVAGGNILSTNTTASIIDNGGNVLLIAGANITSSGGTGGVTIAGSNPAGATTSTITVSLTGGTGGNIDFAGITSAPGSIASTAATAIDTSSSSGAGGNITLVALANANGTSGGNVYFNTAAGTGAINSSGSSGSSGGRVTIFAGANTGTAIQTNSITTGGSTASNGGSVVLAATQASTSDGNSLSIDTTGTIVSLNSIVAGSALTSGNVSIGAINTSVNGTTGGNGGAVAIATQGSVVASGYVTSSGANNSTAGSAGGSGGAVTISAGQGVFLLDVNTSGGTGSNTVGINAGSGGSAGTIAIISSAGEIIAVDLTAAGGAGGNSSFLLGQAGSGGTGGAGGLITLTANNANMLLDGAIASTGGAGGSSSVGRSGGGGAGGAIVLTSGGAIVTTAGSAIIASGGNGAGGLTPGSGGNSGAITFTAGRSISTNTGYAILAQGGAAGSALGNTGTGGLVVLTAGGGNISVGNIATAAGTNSFSGTGGNVIVVAIDGNVTIGNTTASTTNAAINTAGGTQAGAVTVSAAGTIALVSVDSGNNVINTSSAFGSGASVLLASGAASGLAIALDSGNIVTTGELGGFTGLAWVLSLNGTSHGAYQLNGASNLNDYTTLLTSALTGTSGSIGVSFNSGSAPTNFSPGGYSSINTSGTQQTVVSTNGDTTLIVPIVSTNGTISIASSATLLANGGTQVALIGGDGVTVSGALTSNLGAFYLAALVDTSTTGISLSSSAALNLGAAATNGPLNLTMSGTNALSVANTITASNVNITAANINFANPSTSNIIATNITVQSAANLSLSGSGAFTTNGSGLVSLLASTTGDTLTLANGTALSSASPNLVLLADNINLGTGSTISATGTNGNITIESSSGNLNLSGTATLATAASGTTALLAMASSANTLTLTDGTALTITGGGEIDIRTPNLVMGDGTSIAATGSSLVFIDGGTSSAVVPMTITGPAGSSASISTNGGAIFIHPTGDLEFEDSGVQATTINLNASGSLGSGLLDIQGLGNVTVDTQVTLSSNSPIQINLNSNQTLALNGNAILETTFSGDSTFPDPLGGIFDYSILVQNLLSSFNLAGTGTILQAGATPGNTVFNDFIDIGLASGTNLSFQSLNAPGANGSFVNFFTRQIQVNGTALDSAPTASLSANSNVTAINFNTNLPSFGPGNLAFQPGTLASSATLNVTGAPINVGFPGTVPPISIPALQQPVGNINFGIGGSFALTNNQAISMYADGTAIIYPGSSITSTGGNVSIATSSGSNGSIILGGTVSATSVGASVTIDADGTGSIVGAGGSLVAYAVTLTSGTGSIGAAALGSAVNTTASTITAATSGASNVFINQTGAVTLDSSQAGLLGGTFSLTASGDITTAGNVSAQNIALIASGGASNVTIGAANTVDAAGGSLTLTSGAAGIVTVGTVASGAEAEGASVIITTASVVNNGTIQSGSDSGDSTTVANPTGVLTLSGAGTWTNPEALSLSSDGNLNLDNLPAAALTTISLNLTATNGVLTLPVNNLIVSQDTAGDGGSISIKAASVVVASVTEPLVLKANATGTGKGGIVNVVLTGTAPITIGTGEGNLDISATGGATSGNGGSASVEVGGNLVVNPAQISVGPVTTGTVGNGGILDLVAGTGAAGGTLVVKGALSANGVGNGDGGSITLQSNSATAFSIDSSRATNGTQGALSVNKGGSGLADGTISVTNLGSGGVTDLQALTAVDQLTLSSGTTSPLAGNNGAITIKADLGGAATSAINLSANGTGKITAGSSNAIIAANINASSTQGAITLPNIVVATGGSTNLSANTGSKGAVAITNKGSGALDIISAAGAAITIKSLGDISTSGPITGNSVTLQTTARTGGSIIVDGSILATNGNVALTTAGTITVDAAENVSGSKAVTLTASGTSSTITVDGVINNTDSTGTVSLVAAASTAPNAIEANGVSDISGGRSVTLSAPKSSVVVNTIGLTQAPTTVAITALSGITNNGAIKATTTVTEKVTGASGSINVAGNIETTSIKADTGAVTLTASGGGSITSTGFDIGAGKSVTLVATKGSIDVGTIGFGGGTGITPATVSLTALDNITNAGVISAVTSVTEKTTATAGASEIDVAGNITASGSSGAVALTNAGNLSGSSGIVATSNISATKAITLSATKSDITVASVTAGTTVKATAFDEIIANGTIAGTTGVTLATTSTTGTHGGSITVGNISTGGGSGSDTAGGAISVTAAGGTLTVSPLATISATSGKTTKAAITLENKLITGATPGTIVVNEGAQITTGGSLGGNVNIVMGAVPGSPKGDTLPAGIDGLSFTPNNPQSVIFVGATAVNNGINFANTSLTNLINVSVIGTGVKVILNTGALPASAITIDAGLPGQPTIITADPPVVFAAPSMAMIQAKDVLVNALTLTDQPQTSVNLSNPAFAPAQGFSLVLGSALVNTGSLSALTVAGVEGNGNGVTWTLLGSLQSGIAENNVTTVAASTRTLYGTATEYDAEANTPYDYRQRENSGDINATVLSGTDLGIGGPSTKTLEMGAWAGPGTKVKTLHQGNVVVAPDKDTVIETAFGKVKVGANSMALIMALPTGISVYNLDDRHQNSVVITIGKNRMALAPGRHAMITSHLVEAFEMVNPAESFGYRKVSSRIFDGNLQAFTSEFSMTNAIAQVTQLRALVNSQHPQAKRMANHMLKTAAILSQISGGGEYQQYKYPSMTASALVK